MPQTYKNITKAASGPAACSLRPIFVKLRKRHKPSASREKRRCAPRVFRLYDAFTRHLRVARQYCGANQRPSRAAILLHACGGVLVLRLCSRAPKPCEALKNHLFGTAGGRKKRGVDASRPAPRLGVSIRFTPQLCGRGLSKSRRRPTPPAPCR